MTQISQIQEYICVICVICGSDFFCYSVLKTGIGEIGEICGFLIVSHPPDQANASSRISSKIRRADSRPDTIAVGRPVPGWVLAPTK